MGKVLCFIYNEMADFEITLTFHRLKRFGAKEIVSIGYDMETVTAQSGLSYTPHATVAHAVNYNDIDAIIIPGGPIGEQKEELTELLQKLHSEKKLVAAICFAPQFLGRAGILGRHAFTTSCSEEHIKSLGVKNPYPRENYVEKRVVTDGNVITAKGYAFVDFAIAVMDWFGIIRSSEERAKLIQDFKGSD